MIPRDRMPDEEYARIKEADMQKARELETFIKTCGDPYMKDTEQRAVMDIRHMLRTSVELFADNPVFWEKPTHKEPYKAISYREMGDMVDAIGTALHARGLRGKRIAVIGENGSAWATAYLAVACGTGVIVPLDKELGIEEIENLLIESESECVFYTKKFSVIFEQIREAGKTKLGYYVNMDDDTLKPFETSRQLLLDEGRRLIAEGNREFLDAQVLREGMGILLFTSGTTGVSKGVMLSHKNICTDLMIPPTVFPVQPDEIFFSVLPMHHTYECTCGFLMPIYRGASIAYCEGLRYIADNLKEVRPTLFLGVPLLIESLYAKVWQNIRKQGKEGLVKKILAANRITRKVGLDLGNIFFKEIRAAFGGRLRRVICGGAAIDPAVLDGLTAFGVFALQGYGLTECAPICALNPEARPKSDSAGYLISGFEGRIDDPDPETGIGEICVKGDNVMIGYFNNQEATDEVIRDGWFSTGDYGYIDKDKYVYITGRKKSVIITKNGKNVFPEEIEFLLERSELIAASMVWEGEAEFSEDTKIIATIFANDEALRGRLGDSPADDEVAKAIWEEVDRINDGLPIFKRVKKVVLRDREFEVTTSKKIKRFVEENREGKYI